jgi:hypothetical protein
MATLLTFICTVAATDARLLLRLLSAAPIEPVVSMEKMTSAWLTSVARLSVSDVGVGGML